jgi:peroxiredoxin
MKTARPTTFVVSSLAVELLRAPSVVEPSARVRPALLGHPMSDFTLPTTKGGTATLSRLRGKNVLLVFPRGKVDAHWCQICHYQYAELVELEQALQFRKKHRLEVLFILPYDLDTAAKWLAMLPAQLAVINGWKNLPAAPTDVDKRRVAFWRDALPKTLTATPALVPTPFPVLSDGDRAVSKGLGLFTMDWDGSQVDQNVPTVILIDRTGRVRFKYVSQTAFDRPAGEYMMRVLQQMLD